VARACAGAPRPGPLPSPPKRRGEPQAHQLQEPGVRLNLRLRDREPSLVATGLKVGVCGLRYHGYADSELHCLGRLGFVPCRFRSAP